MSLISSARRFERKHYRPLYGALVLAALMVLLALFLLRDLPLFQRAELTAYDSQMQRRGLAPMSNQIVVVGVDETSVNNLGRRYPIPRRWTARLVDFLHRSGARAIGLDFPYLYPQDKRDDAALATSIARAGNVVLSEPLSFIQRPLSDGRLEILPQALYAPIAKRAAATGLMNITLDIDGHLRAVQLMKVGPVRGVRYLLDSNGNLTQIGKRGSIAKCHVNGLGKTGRPTRRRRSQASLVDCSSSNSLEQTYPSMATQMAAIALSKPVPTVTHGLPDRLLINFASAEPSGAINVRAFPAFYFLSVAKGQVDPRSFRNKIVLVFPSTTEAGDEWSTPLGTMAGGIAQANAVNTILNRNPMIPASNTADSIILIVLGLLTAVLASGFGIWRSTALTFLLALGYFALTVVLFDQYRIWLDLVVPITLIGLTFAAVMALRFSTEERRRRKTSNIFGQYVKPEIVDILVNAREEDQALAGARRVVSVLFADIRGFTAASEAMQPEAAVATLDVYLKQLTESVQKFDGTIAKYVGDELMAIWNAPHRQDDHAERALESALDMVDRGQAINEELRSKNLAPVGYGIGINSGEVIVGQMGSPFRKQYDLIGDVVNTASRFCSVAGAFEIIVGDSTRQFAGEDFSYTEVEGLQLKGKSRTARSFRLLGAKPEEELNLKPAAQQAGS